MLCFGFQRIHASLTLYIQSRFAKQMGLPVNNDVFLIRNGIKNKDFRFEPLPAKLNRVELTWLSMKHEEQYSLRLSSSNLKIIKKPSVKPIPLQGTVEKASKTFEIDFKCTGLVGGQVDIRFTLNYTNFKRSTRVSLKKTLEFTIPKQCNKSESFNPGNRESREKKPVDRTVVVTLSACFAVLVCLLLGIVFFWKYVKRIRKKFGSDEIREHLAPRRESFTSSNISIPAPCRMPTVVYSPKRNGSSHCFTKIATHDQTTTTNTQRHSITCLLSENRNSPASPLSFDGQSSGFKDSQDLKLFTQMSIADDDVFASESDVASIENVDQEGTLSLAKDLADKELAFTTLNEYWAEKLGESVKSFEDLKIRTEVLGEGKFGRVLRGKLRVVACNSTETSIDIAVKICQEDIEFEHMVSFVNEAILMKRLCHENLVDLKGVVLQASSAPLILTPFMAHGDLHKFLRHSRGIGIRRQLIGSRQLVNFACQIARGMEYLASQKVVHRDLASRNCLVDGELKVKICDFGLAREVKQFDLYKMEHPTQLAVKWLALESLLYYIFTERSDVWSFGIVLWELVTLGSQPYAGLDNYEVVPYLEMGKRLPRPLRCPDDLYSIMQSCWAAAPDDRPTFSILVHKLEDYESRLRPSCITFEFDEDTIEMSDNCGSF